jgi:hypothetical protein
MLSCADSNRFSTPDSASPDPRRPHHTLTNHRRLTTAPRVRQSSIGSRASRPAPRSGYLCIDVTYAYAPDILESLARHGLLPTETTAPERVRDALSDLYRYEIRRLRARLLDGHIPKADYINHVIALRKRYWLLSLPVQVWTIG